MNLSPRSIRGLRSAALGALLCACGSSTSGRVPASKGTPLVSARVAHVPAPSPPDAPTTPPALPTQLAVSMPPPADVAAPPPDARGEACGSASRLLAPGSGPQRASDDDRVVLDYATFTRSGHALDSSATHGDAAAESVRNLPPGLACVVKRMSVGESRRIWVSAAGLTSDQADPDASPPVDLTIDLTLRELMKAPPRPKDYAAPPAAAQRTATGLRFRILHRGPGGRHPVANSRVTIYHSGWTERGALFESSRLAGQPASFLTYELPKGLSEGIQLMRVGDSARFWLPESLAYAGAHRSAPKGPVVFEVELLAID